MRTDWVQEFIDRYGFPPIAGGAGEPPEDDDDEPGEDEDTEPPADDDTDDEPTEAAKLKARMQAADKRASRFGKERDVARKELVATRVELAVRKAMYERAEKFVDPDLALDLVRDSIATNKKGQPVKVEEALDHLAERHPYLLADEHEPPDDEKVQPEQTLRKSGTHANRQRRAPQRLNTQQLRDKYRALRR